MAVRATADSVKVGVGRVGFGGIGVSSKMGVGRVGIGGIGCFCQAGVSKDFRGSVTRSVLLLAGAGVGCLLVPVWVAGVIKSVLLPAGDGVG